MNQDIQEEKLDQNEELAKLRANTSIEKTILGKTLPSSDQMPEMLQSFENWRIIMKKIKKKSRRHDSCKS